VYVWGVSVVDVSALKHARAALARLGLALIGALSDTNKIILLGLCAREAKEEQDALRDL
jgi:hypothetical protein